MYTKSLKMFSGPTFGMLRDNFLKGFGWTLGGIAATEAVEKAKDSLNKKQVPVKESNPTLVPKP